MTTEQLAYFFSKYKRHIIASLVLVALGLLIYNVAIFRITSINPSLAEMPSSARLIRIDFTQPVKSVEGMEIAGQPIFDESIRIDGRTIFITVPSSGFEADSLTSIRFKTITSKWFGITTSNYLERFTPKYIPYSKLSNEQQAAMVQASDSNQSDDPFLNNKFPIWTDDYSIEASKDTNSSDISVVINFSKDIPDYDVSSSVSGPTGGEAEQLRDAALATIKDKSGDPERYSITYSNVYLTEKYTNNIEK